MPGAGGTQRLTRAVGKYHAMRLTLTGETIGAEEAFAMGLVSKVVDDGAVLEEALAMARHIAGLPPVAVAQIKEVVIQGEDGTYVLQVDAEGLQADTAALNDALSAANFSPRASSAASLSRIRATMAFAVAPASRPILRPTRSFD